MSIEYIFISYVREDTEAVERLKQSLEKFQARLWIDRYSLKPGQDWEVQLRSAIRNAKIFLAVFSQNYHNKEITYMQTELTIALEVHQEENSTTPIFVPIRLNECKIPIIAIDNTHKLSDLHIIDLWPNWDFGVSRLAEYIVPLVAKRENLLRGFRSLLTKHIGDKIEFFKEAGFEPLGNIEERWAGLLSKPTFEILGTHFVELYIKAFDTGNEQNETIVEPGPHGRVIEFHINPHLSAERFVASLSPEARNFESKYLNYIYEKRVAFRSYKNWDKRDFVNIVFFEQNDEILLDMFYLLSFDLYLSVLGYMQENGQELRKQGSVKTFGFQQIYPTSLMSTNEGGPFLSKILQEEAGLL